MRIYMAGSAGMLGDAFIRHFGSKHELMCTDIDTSDDRMQYCDFRNYAEYSKQVAKWKPDFLFHLGAHTDLEYCEKNPDDTYLTNALSVEGAVQIANNLNIPLLYISTAGIFDGQKELYDDWDVPNPMCAYARAKYMGERYVVENMRRYFVCRAGWMMGGGLKKDKKFVKKIVAQLLEGRRELNIVTDKLGTPTYTHDFAANVDALMQTDYYGVYNMVCEGATSRFEVAKELVRLLGLEKEVTLKPVDSSFFRAEYFAPRPDSERLVNRKLALRNLNTMRDWRLCLKEYVEEHYLKLFP
ncbi:MAG: sugar nucleotide-binding protein [Nitrospiraceae bacterium]|nr:sugar nucleotide-binding protein [Nitrospiraceae bacterium]